MPYTPEELELLDFGKKIEALNKRNYFNEVRRISFEGMSISDDELNVDDNKIEINNNFRDQEGKLVFFQDPDSLNIIESIEFDGYRVGEKQKKLTIHYRDEPTLDSYETDEFVEKETFRELPDLKDKWI